MSRPRLAASLAAADGTVCGVNPTAREVEGYRCVASAADLPFVPDLAVLPVRNERVEKALEEAVSAGAKAAAIFASAVLADDTDPSLAARLARIAARAGIPVGGPNCMGC